MYCAGCGTQIQSGLNYCSRCGRRVADDTKSKYRNNPLVIVGNTAGIGFVAFIFVLLVLSKGGLPPDVFKTVAAFYFVALFGLCFMLLRHGTAENKRAEVVPSAEPSSEPAYLRPVTTAQLEEFREPASVTDHTTRTLDEAPIPRS